VPEVIAWVWLAVVAVAFVVACVRDREFRRTTGAKVVLIVVVSLSAAAAVGLAFYLLRR
jgi:CHASE2 domain-containing sensor protein